jgi:hypothetical protein
MQIRQRLYLIACFALFVFSGCHDKPTSSAPAASIQEASASPAIAGAGRATTGSAEVRFNVNGTVTANDDSNTEVHSVVLEAGTRLVWHYSSPFFIEFNANSNPCVQGAIPNVYASGNVKVNGKYEVTCTTSDDAPSVTPSKYHIYSYNGRTMPTHFPFTTTGDHCEGCYVDDEEQ